MKLDFHAAVGHHQLGFQAGGDHVFGIWPAFGFGRAAEIDQIGMQRFDARHQRTEFELMGIDAVVADHVQADIVAPLGEQLGHPLAIHFLIVEHEDSLHAHRLAQSAPSGPCRSSVGTTRV